MNEDTIMLGTPVVTTEAAVVVRRWKKEDASEWFVPEKGNLEGVDPAKLDMGMHMTETGEVSESTNKSVVRFPAYRSGIIVGEVRKYIGESVAGGMGRGSWDSEPDYEPGYLNQHGHVDLYVVKASLKGQSWYAPKDATSPMHTSVPEAGPGA